jgi:8-oxo-dGTP diphosphatase
MLAEDLVAARRLWIASGTLRAELWPPKTLSTLEGKGGVVIHETRKLHRVVTALIERDGRYLITQRCDPEALAGLWEFPSGEVDQGTTDEAVIRHVLHERLGIDTTVSKLKACRTQKYAEYSVEVVLYEVGVPPNQAPRSLAVADFRWVAPTELEQYHFLPTDRCTTDLLLGIKREQPKGHVATADAEVSGRAQKHDN